MARPKKTPNEPLNEPETEQQDALPEQQPEQTDQPKQPTSKIQVRPVHGPMHHLFLDVPIAGVTTFDEMDNWLECQIDAGKLELV